MNLEVSKYRIELVDESDYSSNSTDNHSQYEQQYVNEQEYKPTTQIGIKLYVGKSLISSAIVRSTGGTSEIHQTSQILTNDILTICCAKSVFNLSIPELTLKWIREADEATCIQIFKHEEDFIIHGELSISRLTSNGEILWQISGADIFTTEKGENNFELKNDIIQVRDWNNQLYKFDLDGKQIK